RRHAWRDRAPAGDAPRSRAALRARQDRRGGRAHRAADQGRGLMAEGAPGTLADAARLLADARRVLLTCHLGPDGDAAGSMSSLACLFRAAGKQVTLY